MTQKRTIRIIKGVGPGLSTRQLEEVSLRLLLSRIRGAEPQISFNFVQRLLDELILRRHDDVKQVNDMDKLLEDTLLVPDSDVEWTEGSDDVYPSSADSLDEASYVALACPEEWDPTDSFDLRSLEYSDLETTDEEVGTAEDEEVYVEPVKTKRTAVLAYSKPRHSMWSSISPLRVLTISVLVALTMACGVLVMGCNHHDPKLAIEPEAVDSVGGVFLNYKDLNDNPVDLDLKRRGDILAAAVIMIEAFKADHNGRMPRVWVCDVYVGATPADNPSYVPCGIVNGGGCFNYDTHIMKVNGGDCDNVPYIYHELTHALLEEDGEDRISNNGHQGPQWVLSSQRTYDLRNQICASRAPAPVLTTYPPLAMPR